MVCVLWFGIKARRRGNWLIKQTKFEEIVKNVPNFASPLPEAVTL